MRPWISKWFSYVKKCTMVTLRFRQSRSSSITAFNCCNRIRIASPLCIRQEREQIQKLDRIIVECLKIGNILEINFFKSTYPGFFFKGLKKLFELSGFSSYPGSSYPVYFNRKHICFFKGPENLFELGEVRVIRVRVIRFPLYIYIYIYIYII